MAYARWQCRACSSTCRWSKKSDGESEALGRSRGGFSSKINVVCDALGNPLVFTVVPGQRHEITQAELLLKYCRLTDEQRAAVKAVLGDKGYDSNDFVEQITCIEAQAVIPSRKSRKEPRAYDSQLYKERNKVERFFNRIKHYRRIATRYEKAVRNYESFLHIACIMTWLL